MCFYLPRLLHLWAPCWSSALSINWSTWFCCYSLMALFDRNWISTAAMHGKLLRLGTQSAESWCSWWIVVCRRLPYHLRWPATVFSSGSKEKNHIQVMDGTASGGADTPVHFKRHLLDITGLSKYFRSQVWYQPGMKILNCMKLDESTLFVEWLACNRKALQIQCFHSSIFSKAIKILFLVFPQYVS